MSKYGYSVGDIAKFLSVESHTVRFWMKELSEFFNPILGPGGRHYFSEEDLQIFKKIKHLTYEKGIRLAIIKRNGIDGEEKPTLQKNTIHNNNQDLLKLISNIEQQVNNLLNML